MKTDDDYDKERELEEKKEAKRQKKEANGEVVDGEIETTVVVDGEETDPEHVDKRKLPGKKKNFDYKLCGIIKKYFVIYF
jgi:hypothetical protein